MRDYSHFLQYAFKRFSVTHAPRTGLPTAGFFLRPFALPPSDRVALCTMNILPPMMTVWHHFARKAVGDDADIVIFDCSGYLNSTEFPGATVLPFLNLYAATQADIFLQRIAKNRRIAWLCDDDVFLMGHGLLPRIKQEFTVPGTASLSFEPRPWWHFDIDGKTTPPSGTYCLALDRRIVVDKECLSLRPEDGNEHPSHIAGKPVKRYDTFDKANETLLKKGYRCAIVGDDERQNFLAGFDGVSGAVMILSAFKNPQEVMDYLEGPPLEQWSGNILFRVLNGLLAVSCIQELYTRLKGHPYALHSLPDPLALERLQKKVEPYLREEISFRGTDETAERLRTAL